MRPQQGSLAKATLDRLHALLTADPTPAGLAGVQVLYGPPTANDLVSHDVLQLAPGNFDDPGITVTRTPEPGLGRTAYRTDTEVVAWLATYSGDTDMEPLLAHTDGIFGGVKKVLDGAQVDPDTWDSLRLGEQEVWSPVQTEDGATVVVLFTIVATAVG